MHKRITDTVPRLVELGKTENPSVFDQIELPKARDFSALWQQWDSVVAGWSVAQIRDLIKGLTHFERIFHRQFGSVPPVANLFGIFESKATKDEADQLADWVLRNTVNSYSPFGTHNHGARSLKEVRERESLRCAIRRCRARKEHQRLKEAEAQRALVATERLPNALRRGDSKAVAALMAKGADADVVGSFGKSARAMADELGVLDWIDRNPPADS
jgi:hypothetical protein